MKKSQIMGGLLILLIIIFQIYPKSEKTIVKDVQTQTLLTEFFTTLKAAQLFAIANKKEEDNQLILANLREINSTKEDKWTRLEKKKLSPITISFIQNDIAFLKDYPKTGDSRLLQASLKNMNAIAVANQNDGTEENKVEITIITKNGKAKRCDGFRIKWTLPEWIDLPNPPKPISFPDTSITMDKLPAGYNILIWSEIANDESIKGDLNSLLTDKTKTETIGTPKLSKHCGK